VVGQLDPRHRHRVEHLQSGTWELRADPKPGGGSTVTVINDRRPKGKGLVFAPVMMIRGRKMLADQLRRTLGALEQEPEEGTPTA
jgi:hypothetical protein